MNSFALLDLNLGKEAPKIHLPWGLSVICGNKKVDPTKKSNRFWLLNLTVLVSMKHLSSSVRADSRRATSPFGEGTLFHRSLQGASETKQGDLHLTNTGNTKWILVMLLLLGSERVLVHSSSPCSQPAVLPPGFFQPLVWHSSNYENEGELIRKVCIALNRDRQKVLF